MDNTDHKRNVLQVSVAMGNVTLVLKGEQDLISDGSKGLCLTPLLTFFLHSWRRECGLIVCFQWWRATSKAVGGGVADRVTFCPDPWEFWHTGLILPPQLGH